MLDERPWTTARCNRLLRPLATSLASLSARSKDAREQNFPKSAATLTKRKPTKTESTESTDDLDWTNSGPRKRVKRTYGGRSVANSSTFASSQTRQRPKCRYESPGEICITTPFLNRKAFGYDATSLSLDPESKTDTSEYGILTNLETTTCRNRKMTPVESVKTSFISLLEQTREETPTPIASHRRHETLDGSQSQGAKSLFSLCLENIPAHILDEQTWRKAQNVEDKSDVSAEVYEYLEGLEIKHGKGWEPLREVVRAHGVSIVLQAIEKKLFTVAEIQSIIMICIRRNALTEGKRLIRGWVIIQKSFPFPSSPPIASFNLQETLNVLSWKLETCAFQYRLLTEMMTNSALAIEWVTTLAFKSLWYRLINSMSTQDEDSEQAVSFTTILLCLASRPAGTDTSEAVDDRKELVYPDDDASKLLIGKPPPTPHQAIHFQEALTNTISSLVTILCALKFIADGPDGNGPSEGKNSKLTDPIRHTTKQFDQSLLPAAHEVYRDFLLNRLLICGADLVITCLDSKRDDAGTIEAFEKSVSRLSNVTDTYDSDPSRDSKSRQILSGFICSVARCYGRAQAYSGFNLLTRIVQSLLDYLPRCNETHGEAYPTFLRRVALDSIMEFTQTSKDLLEYPQLSYTADQLMYKLTAVDETDRSMDRSSKVSTARFDGLRWEDGICEWVVATPATIFKAKAPKPYAKISSGQPSFLRKRQSHHMAHKDVRIPSTNETLDADGDDIELVDSGICMAEDELEVTLQASRRKRSLGSLRRTDSGGNSILDSDDEDELVADVSSHVDSFRLERNVAKGDELKRDVAKHKQRKALELWDLTSDELG